MMDEHLHKVFPLHIHELRYGQGPVEGQLHHVVPPHGPLYIMMRVVIPKFIQYFSFHFEKNSLSIIFSREATLELAMLVRSSVRPFVTLIQSIKIKRQNKASK